VHSRLLLLNFMAEVFELACSKLANHNPTLVVAVETRKGEVGKK
jgi:hypothetical protein